MFNYNNLYSEEIKKQGQKKTHPFIVISPQKCGTHLVGAALGLMIDQTFLALGYFNSDEEAMAAIENATQNKRFILTHQKNSSLLKLLVDKGYKIISIIRDPRDQLISLLDVIQTGTLPPLTFPIEDINEYIEELITGERFGWRSYDFTKNSLDALVPLVDENHCYFTKFEDLIGSRAYSIRI